VHGAACHLPVDLVFRGPLEEWAVELTKVLLADLESVVPVGGGAGGADAAPAGGAGGANPPGAEGVAATPQKIKLAAARPEAIKGALADVVNAVLSSVAALLARRCPQPEDMQAPERPPPPQAPPPPPPPPVAAAAAAAAAAPAPPPPAAVLLAGGLRAALGPARLVLVPCTDLLSGWAVVAAAEAAGLPFADYHRVPTQGCVLLAPLSTPAHWLTPNIGVQTDPGAEAALEGAAVRAAQLVALLGLLGVGPAAWAGAAAAAATHTFRDPQLRPSPVRAAHSLHSITGHTTDRTAASGGLRQPLVTTTTAVRAAATRDSLEFILHTPMRRAGQGGAFAVVPVQAPGGVGVHVARHAFTGAPPVDAERANEDAAIHALFAAAAAARPEALL
jgi:hypothetical protein